MLLLDEPFDGVDPLGVEATMDVIADARARGAAVLVSTHLRELAVEACQDAHRAARRLGRRRAAGRRDDRGGGRRCLPRAPRLTARPGAAVVRDQARGRRRRGRCCASGPPACGAGRGGRGVRPRRHRRLTVLAAWLPGVPPRRRGRRTDVLSLLPSALVGVLLIAVISAAASGGGRELVPREQAVGFPVSPTTDHLGALLMAPLNIAWLLQSWALLGAIAYVAGAGLGLRAHPAAGPALAASRATAIAQVVGWARGVAAPRPARGLGGPGL